MRGGSPVEAGNEGSPARPRPGGATPCRRGPPGPAGPPPVRAASSPAVTGRAPGALSAPTLLALLQPRHNFARDVEQRVGGDDVVPRRVGVEDDRIVAFGSQPLDHGVDPYLERLEQLLLALLRFLLQLARAPLEALLLLLQLLLLRLFDGRRQRDRLLVERLDRGIELALQLLHLVPESLELAVERRLGGRVAGRLLHHLARIDEGDLEAGAGGLSRRRVHAE